MELLGQGLQTDRLSKEFNRLFVLAQLKLGHPQQVHYLGPIRSASRSRLKSRQARTEVAGAIQAQRPLQ